MIIVTGATGFVGFYLVNQLKAEGFKVLAVDKSGTEEADYFKNNGIDFLQLDITKEEEYQHPVTKTDIVGFTIPFWNDAIDMVIAAALNNKNNRSVGWDVAISESGPELIEGNHNWCKLLWQLPVKKGLKPLLEGYLIK